MAPCFLPAISTMSLGRATHHAIEPKLASCSRHGFTAIELYYEDLESAALTLPSSHPLSSPGTAFLSSTQWDEQLLSAANYIHSLCEVHRLQILCIQPFLHYEGLLDRNEHASRIRKLKLWFRLAAILKTDMIQIPSNFLPASECTGDRETVVRDLREAADLAAQSSIRLAYEALAWGTHTNTWEAAYAIVQAVDRPNLGLVIDSFNLAGRVYGDPTQPSGRTRNAQEDLSASLNRLRKGVDVKKLFYVELVDGERLERPLVKGHEWFHGDQDARMSWSRNARLFPGEDKGYLPVFEVLDAVCEVGYEGYISFEYFNRSMDEVGDGVPDKHGVRAEESWRKVLRYIEQRDAPKKEETGPRVTIGESRQTNEVREDVVTSAAPRFALSGPGMVDPI